MRARKHRHQLRTLRETTVQVCLVCDWAALLPDDDPSTTVRGPKLEFEPIPWPPKAEKRG